MRLSSECVVGWRHAHREAGELCATGQRCENVLTLIVAVPFVAITARHSKQSDETNRHLVRQLAEEEQVT